MKRPYTIINCAASADGKIALPIRRQTRISSQEDMRRVHALRNSADAILVGIGTVLADDPKLTVKREFVKKARNPVRIVLDSGCRIPGNALVLNSEAKTLIVTSRRTKRKLGNAEILVCGKEGRVDLKRLMVRLRERGIGRLLVEGGGDAIYAFLREGLADELKIFVGNMVIGGKGPTVAGGEGAEDEDGIIPLELKKATRMKGGILLEYLVIK